MLSLLQKAESLKLIERIKSSTGNLQLQDLYQWLDQYSPPVARGLLSYVLPWLRPYSQGRWYRVARLTDNEIEISIPNEISNRDSYGSIHEAVLFGAALEAATLFWWRHLEETPQVQIRDVNFRALKKSRGNLRLRTQIAEKTVEVALSSLRSKSIARMEIPFRAFDDNNNLMAEIEVKLEVSITPLLGKPRKKS